MPVYHKLVNLEEVFHTARNKPIILNDLKIVTEQDRESLRNHIYTKHSSDTMNVLPTCDCGNTSGEYAVGDTCVYCGTKVTIVADEIIEPILWFRAPTGVRKLINPAVWVMLNTYFSKSGFSILQWLTDTTYKPKGVIPPFVNEVVDSGIQRGYNYFVDNFDNIIDYLFNHKVFSARLKNRKINSPNHLRELIRINRGILFSEYLPIPNKMLLIIEENPLGRYMDFTNTPAIDTVLNVAGIDSNNIHARLRVKENSSAKAINQLAYYYHEYHRKNIAGKPGMFRKNVIASRTHYSFRVVATSITDPHDYTKVLAPWCVGLTTYRHHVMNKLLARGYTLNAAIGLIHKHIRKYLKDPLGDILDEIIAESPYDGLPCIIQRNPSLPMGSAQYFLIKEFKKDGKDCTIGVPILTVKAPNLDFDGLRMLN